MKKFIVAFGRIKKHQKVISILLSWMSVICVATENLEGALLCVFVLLFYLDRVMTPPEVRKQMAATRFRSSFSDPLDPGNPTGFNNPASPLSHMHNSPSVSNTFDTYRG